MSFANPQLLYLLLLVPLGIVLGIVSLRHREQRLQSFADLEVLHEIAPSTGDLRRRGWRRTAFLCSIIALMVIAALGPRWGFRWKEGKRHGIDLVLAVDLSDSMLAQDIQPDRLGRARRKMEDLLQLLRGDRVGLVSFAGLSFIEIPLTVDYGAFLLFLENLKPEYAPVKGSNIELAVQKSFELLGFKDDNSKPAEGTSRSKAILLMSDGEQLEGDVDAVIQRAKSLGVKIYTLGIGTPEGSPIFGDGGYKKDSSGRVIVSRLQENILTKLAVETGGVYVKSVAGDEDLKTLYLQGIKQSLKDSTLDAEKSKRWNEYFQVPLFVAVLVLLMGSWGNLLAGLFSRRQSKRALAEKSSAAVAIGLLMITLLARPALAESSERIAKKARQDFESGDFQSALKLFGEAQTEANTDPRFGMGVGASQYRLGDFPQAQAAFFDSAAKATNPLDKSSALYNAGNSQVQQKDYKGAIKTYEDALKLAPNDQEIKDNLAYAKRLLEQQQQQNKQDKNDQQQKQDQKDQQQQQQQGSQGQKENQDKSQDQEQQQQQQDQQQNSDQDNQQQEKQQDQKQQQSSNPEEKQADQPQSEKQQSEEKDQQNPENKNQSANTESQEDHNKSPDKDEQKQNSEGEATETPTPQPSGDEKDESKDPSQNGSAGGEGEQEDNSKPSDNPLESLLDGIEEKNESRLKYRGEKAARELKAQHRKPPAQDW